MKPTHPPRKTPKKPLVVANRWAVPVKPVDVAKAESDIRRVAETYSSQ